MLASTTLLITLLISLSCLVPHRRSKDWTITKTVLADSVSMDLIRPVDLDISPSGNQIAIVDGATGAILLYSYPSFAFIRSIEPTNHLSDSLALKEFGVAKIYRCMTRSMAPREYAANKVKNDYLRIAFTDDSTLLILGILRCITIHAPRKVFIEQGTAIIRCNVNGTVLTATPLKPSPNGSYPQSEQVCLDGQKKKLILYVGGWQQLESRQFDSAWMLAEYTVDGTFLRYISLYPREARRYSLDDYMMIPKAAYTNDSQLWVGVETVARIQNARSGKEISMNVPLKNELFFQKRLDLLTTRPKGSWSLDSLFQYKPFSLTRLASDSSGNIVAICSQKLSQVPLVNEHYVQFYSQDGELVDQLKIGVDQTGECASLIKYIPAFDYVIALASIKEEGWRALTFCSH